MNSFELAISTMYKDESQILELITNMNVTCDCIIVNQCDEEKDFFIKKENQNIHILFSKERGLSKSRNLAIKNAVADIIGLADDDLLYYDGFDRKILDYYERNKKAEIVLFNMDDWERSYKNFDFKCNFFQLSSFTSMQITFRRKNIEKKFNIYFGTGSKQFDSGEENIFLTDNFKNGKRIFYCAEKILKRDKSESSWFKGYNDKKYITDRGAIYYAISPILWYLYIIRFAIVKRNKLKPHNTIKALRMMYDGKNLYKSLIKRVD